MHFVLFDVIFRMADVGIITSYQVALSARNERYRSAGWQRRNGRCYRPGIKFSLLHRRRTVLSAH